MFHDQIRNGVDVCPINKGTKGQSGLGTTPRGRRGRRKEDGGGEMFSHQHQIATNSIT